MKAINKYGFVILFLVFLLSAALMITGGFTENVCAADQRPVISEESLLNEYGTAKVRWESEMDSTGYVLAWKRQDISDGDWHYIETKAKSAIFETESACCTVKVRDKDDSDGWSEEFTLETASYPQYYEKSVTAPQITKTDYKEDGYDYDAIIECTKVSSDDQYIVKYEFAEKLNNSVEWGYQAPAGEWRSINDFDQNPVSIHFIEPTAHQAVFPGESYTYKVRAVCFDKQDNTKVGYSCWSEPVTVQYPIPKLQLSKYDIVVDFGKWDDQEIFVKLIGPFRYRGIRCKPSNKYLECVECVVEDASGVMITVTHPGKQSVVVTDEYNQTAVINVNVIDLPKIEFTKKVINIVYPKYDIDRMIRVDQPPFLKNEDTFETFSLPESKVLVKMTANEVFVKNVGTVGMTFYDRYDRPMKVKCNVIPRGTSLASVKGRKKAIKLKWRKQGMKMSKKRISGYQIKYSTDKTYKTAKILKVKNYKRTSKVIKRLKRHTKYYVKVRTYMKVGKTTYYSKWSKTKTVRTR